RLSGSHHKRDRRRTASSWSNPLANPSSEGMERHEFVRRRAEEMPSELRKLFARLRECAVPHLRDAAGVVQRVASLRRRLIDAPDRLAVMAVAGDDLSGAQ